MTVTGSRDQRRADAACIGFLTLSGMAFAAVPLLRGELFFFWDNAKLYFPQALALHEGLRAGGLPQWDHSASAGYPLVGEGQAAVFHPIHLLLNAIFPAHAAFMLEVGLYTALAGVGAYAFVRMFGGHWPALLAGLVAMFGGFPVVSVRNISHTRSLWLLPFLMIAAERFVAGGSRATWLLLAGLGFGLQLLSGNPHYAAVTAAATGLWVVVRAGQRAWDRDAPLKEGARQIAGLVPVWVVAPALGFGIAAIQIVPQLLHAEQSTRAGGMSFEWAMQLPANLRYMGQLLLPFAYEQGHLVNGTDFNEVSYRGLYMGVAPAVLAVLAIWRSRPFPDPTRALALLGLIGGALALGSQTPLYPALWTLPVFGSLRFPHRFMAILAFCIPALAALGLGRLMGPRSEAGDATVSRLGRDAAPVVLVFALSLAGAAYLWLAPPPWLLRATDFERGALLSLALVTTACLLVLAMMFMEARRALCVAILIFTAGDLWWFRARADYAPTARIEDVVRPPPLADFLARDPDEFRIMSLEGWEEASVRTEDLREFLQANTSRLWNVDSADQYSSLMLGRYFAVHQRIVQELLYQPGASSSLASYLGAWNVKYVVAPRSLGFDGWEPAFETERGMAWRNPLVQPRAFVVRDVIEEAIQTTQEWAARGRTRLGRYPESVRHWDTRVEESQIVDNIMSLDIDYRTTAVVAGLESAPALTARSATVESLFRGNEMRFAVTTDGAGLLVVSSTHYPGWTATVNGTPTTIYRTNWVMSGVLVPEGRSEVVMTFATPGLAEGRVASVLTLLLTVGTLAFTGLTRRRRTTAPDEPSPPVGLRAS